MEKADIALDHIKDRDYFHDENARLEEKLYIAIEALDNMTVIANDLDDAVRELTEEYDIGKYEELSKQFVEALSKLRSK